MTVAEVAEQPRESNSTFARRVGCNHTMASRLRSGKRMPSAALLVRICQAYGLDHGDALSHYAQGPEAFSAWLRSEVFRDAMAA